MEKQNTFSKKLIELCLVTVIAVITTNLAHSGENIPEPRKQAIVTALKGWCHWIDNPPDTDEVKTLRLYSDGRVYEHMKYYPELVAFGPSALPDMIEIMVEDDTSWRLGTIILDITRDRRLNSFYTTNNREHPREFLKYWHEINTGMMANAVEKIQQWNSAYESSSEAEKTNFWNQVHRGRTAADKQKSDLYYSILDMGIGILPFLVDEFKKGNYALFPIANYLTASKAGIPRDAPRSAKAETFIKWWSENKEAWQIPYDELENAVRNIKNPPQ